MTQITYYMYCRKSSESEDRQVQSNQDQINALKNLALAKKLKIIKTLTEDKSAKLPNQRPIFNQMLQDIESGKAQGIICWQINRLSRNPVDSGKISWLLQQGILKSIQTITREYLPEDNILLFNVESGMANEYIRELSRNTKRGLLGKAERGWLPSGAKPGYMNDKFAEKGAKTLKKDSMRFPLIRKAWDLMLTGLYTTPQVLDKLNNEWGYRTLKRKRLGCKPMARSALYNVFSDPFYYGRFEFPKGSGAWYQGKHKPMITKDEFNRVQALLGKKGQPVTNSNDLSFTGLMTCGECGCRITTEVKRQLVCSSCKLKFHYPHKDKCPGCNLQIDKMKNPTILQYVYYRCTKKKIDYKCSQPSIRLKLLEEQIDNELAKLAISKRFTHWAIKQLNKSNDKEILDRNATQSSLQSTYTDCVQRLDNLVKLKISPQNTDESLLSDEEFKLQKQSILKEKESIKEKLDDTDNRVNKWVDLTEKTFNFATYAHYWFNHGTKEDKRAIFQALGQNLTLKNKVLEVKLHPHFKIFENQVVSLKTKVPGLEPKEKIDKSTNYELLWSQNPSMLQLKDAFRNRKIKLDITLSDLKIAFNGLNLPQPALTFT